MVLRREIRTAHRNSTGLSAGEKELAENEFHFIKFKRNSALVSDVWNVFPEDEHSGEYHYAPFPEDLVKILLRSLALKVESFSILSLARARRVGWLRKWGASRLALNRLPCI